MTTLASKLPTLSTEDLIGQYDLAISSHSGRHTNHGPRQVRINRIVDLISDRADANDAIALAWFEIRD